MLDLKVFIKTALCEILRRRNFISSKQRVIAFSTNPREVSIAGRLHCQGKKINSIILTKMASFLQSGFCQWILWWFHEKGFISAYSLAYDLLTLIFVCEIRLVHYFLFHRFWLNMDGNSNFNRFLILIRIIQKIIQH